MIQPETRLTVADNSGAKQLYCIKVLGGSPPQIRLCRRHYSRFRQGGLAQLKVKKRRRDKAVVVRTVKEVGAVRRLLYQVSMTISAVLINNQKEPIGTRIFGPVARELRAKSSMKIVSLAPEVI